MNQKASKLGLPEMGTVIQRPQTAVNYKFCALPPLEDHNSLVLTGGKRYVSHDRFSKCLRCGGRGSSVCT